jgi:hypothetical protein
MENHDLKLGEAVVVVWKKADGSAIGGTEGLVVAKTGDKVSGEYIVLDRSTYQDSLKSVLFSLGFLDLKAIPIAEIESAKTVDLRKRPPNVQEKLHWEMEIDYKSNIDYNETLTKLQRHNDFKVLINQPGQTDGSSGITVSDICGIAEAKILISPKGNVQIHCRPVTLENCIKWIQEIVEIFPDHTHLVLIPTNFMFNIHDNFKATAHPSEEVIDRVAKTEGNQSIILPLGWVNEFFVELDRNPLQKLFPNSESIDDLVLIHDKKKKENSETKVRPAEPDFKQPLNLEFPQKQVAVNRYLGANAPVLQATGMILSPEEEAGLIRFWLDRSGPWKWMTLPGWAGKTIVRDLTIDRTNGEYAIDFCKYYGNEFFATK